MSNSFPKDKSKAAWYWNDYRPYGLLLHIWKVGVGDVLWRDEQLQLRRAHEVWFRNGSTMNAFGAAWCQHVAGELVSGVVLCEYRVPFVLWVVESRIGMVLGL